MTDLPRNRILQGDVTERLAELPPAQVDCVISSPPYYQLRDYGVAGQLGLEPTVDDWVNQLRAVGRQLARVLKPTGSLWLNLGDSFSRHARYGAPPKSLLLAPERLLIGLAADGWIVRNKVIWAKPNPMPTSVSDRLTLSYEVVYFLVRSRRYFFDLGAIREPFTSGRPRARARRPAGEPWRGPLGAPRAGLSGASGNVRGKNPGDVWTLPTRGYRGAHFATFPPALLTRPLLATCPEAVCTHCHRPWQRQVQRRQLGTVAYEPRDRFVAHHPRRWRTQHVVGDLVPCGCDAPTRPGVVLDPFFGTGTVGEVAAAHGRDWLGIELNPAYIDLARRRLRLDDAEAA